VGPWERFARWYDLDQGGFDEDIPFYQALAQRTGSPILELGCGTGRLVLALACAGHHVVGVDNQPAMLAVAQQKVQAAGPQMSGRIRLLPADMCDLDLPDRFRLAILAVNTFMHIADPQEQGQILGCVFRHLAAGAMLALDLFPPHPDLLSPGAGEILLGKALNDPATGNLVLKFVARQADYARQILTTTFIYDEVDAEGQVRRTAHSFPLRYLHRSEVEQMLQAAGFAVEGLYGSYDLDPYDDASERMLFLARRPG